jgi:hypothetical protein
LKCLSVVRGITHHVELVPGLLWSVNYTEGRDDSNLESEQRNRAQITILLESSMRVRAKVY